jgi:hypothetical protein
MKEIVTLERLKEFDDHNEAIQWAQEQMPEFPDAPKRPRLALAHTSKEAELYAVELQQFEASQQNYKAARNAVQSLSNAIDAVICEFIKQDCGLESVPEQYREKLWNKAWEDGHSSGYYEVHNKLLGLVEIF